MVVLSTTAKSQLLHCCYDQRQRTEQEGVQNKEAGKRWWMDKKVGLFGGFCLTLFLGLGLNL